MKNNYVVAVVAGIIIGSVGTYFSCIKELKFADKYKIIQECDDLLKEKKVPEHEIDEVSILNGYLASYDKYTFYTKNSTDYENIVGYVNALPTAKGMGFQVEFDESGNLFFSNIEENSQAELQGLEKNDIIIAVNNVKLSESGIEVAKKIGGKANTKFNLTIERNNEEIELELTRYSSDVSFVNTLKSEKIGEILYLKICHISSGTNIPLEEFLRANDFKSVIIDLRNNSGGDTGTAVLVADCFVSEGNLTTYCYTGETEIFNCNYNENDVNVPIVILVNEKTASAAEIITGILKQYGNATLIGTKTFGKGIFQYLEPFHDGILKYTAGYFTVGDWDCWQGKGIAPDIEVEMEYDESIIGTDEDIQLQKALEILNN